MTDEPTPSVSLTARQFDALADDLATFPPASQRRGREYAVAGRVRSVRPKGNGFQAEVLGQVNYDVTWRWSGGHWDTVCSCPLGPYCKHAYAAATMVLARSERALARNDARVDALVPAALREMGDSEPKPSGRPAARLSLIDRLRSHEDPRERQQILLDLLVEARLQGMSVDERRLAPILADADPDLLCWRLAEVFEELPESVRPAGFETYRNRPDLLERFRSRERGQLAGALLSWGESRHRVPERRLRAVLDLEPMGESRFVVRAEVRLTSARNADVPRTLGQLQLLRSELQHGGEGLEPDAMVLLDWATDPSRDTTRTRDLPDRDPTAEFLPGRRLRGLLMRLADSPLVTWGSLAKVPQEVQTRAGITPGSIVRRGEEGLRILPRFVEDGDRLEVELACLDVEGRWRRLDELLYLPGSPGGTHPGIVLAEGRCCIVTEEPPSEIRTRFLAVGQLPLPPAERAALLPRLAVNFPHLATEIAAHTREIPTSPVVVLDLREDDWMQVRIYGRSRRSWIPGEPIEPGDLVFEHGPQGRWEICAPDHVPVADLGEALPPVTPIEPVPASAGDEAVVATPAPDPTPEPASLWLEMPRLEPLGPAVEWVSKLGARPGHAARRGTRGPQWEDAAVGWWLRLTRKTSERLAEAWEDRPDSVAFYGTPRLRRLLTGEIRLRPRLSVEASGVDWFRIGAEWEAEGTVLKEEDLALLRQATGRFVRISTGWVQRDAIADADQVEDALADLGIEAGEEPRKVSIWELVGVRDESLTRLETMGADPATVAAARQLRQTVAEFQGVAAVPTPSALQAELRPYQQHGLEFLAHAAAIRSGAVLADDMGLGKTLQALAWILHLREQEPGAGPCLVVCPASVVHNWEREAHRFAPGLRVLVLGSGKERHELRAEIPDHDLVVTNYALLRRDVLSWREVDLHAVIFDEAQQIKNPDAAVTQAATEVRARHRIALTGTPLENRALDLFSIVEVVNPGYLGRRTRFQARFDRPDSPPHLRKLLSARLRPLMLRRTKGEVAPELPERIEERQDCDLTPAQRALYVAEVQRSRTLLRDLTAEPGSFDRNRIHVLAALTRLRQICCHPRLAGAAPTGEVAAESGKFEALFELLEPLLAEGHKVLVFSQFVTCIRLLQEAMKDRGLRHHVLTGQTLRRAEVVDAFQNDPDPSVFLISLKAGGTGLNLTAASYVVLFDPWWNPAVEAQAIDRTHRIGQDRTVIAYRLIGRGTIEERIFELQQRKASLVRDILGEDGFARNLTPEDLAFLLEPNLI